MKYRYIEIIEKLFCLGTFVTKIHGLIILSEMEENTFTDKTIDRIRNIHHGNFLDYLSSAYEVLRKIFSYLSLDDLDTVSEAFEKWRFVAEITRRERTVIDSFVFSFKNEECSVRSEAIFCITFFMEEINGMEEKLHKHLKEDAQFLMIESRAGVIGTRNDFSELIQQRMLNYSNPPANTPIATHLRIPSFPNVGIKTFVRHKSDSFDDLQNSFSLPENKIIKCLIILFKYVECNRKPYEQRDDFVYFLQTTQSESFAIGGCLIDSFFDDPEAVTKYIVFYGDNVEAASVVLHQNVQTKERINYKLAKLKSFCPKTERGVVFVFRCCSRHKISRLSKVKRNLISWEGEALAKNFPSTPIIGCYGYGEFGMNFPESETLRCHMKRPKPLVILEYSFSTSVVYVGFKK